MKLLVTILSVTVLVLGVLLFSTDTDENITIEETQQSEENSASKSTMETDDSGADTVIDVTTDGVVINQSGEGLSEVSMSVFERTDATTLDLSDNNLSGALQAEVRHLQNLEVLDLSDNNFTGVPAEVGQLTKLRVLDLSNNPITGLPYEIGNLSNLELLDLRGTQYSEQDLAVILQSLPESVEVRR